jgi:hypothetical protein
LPFAGRDSSFTWRGLSEDLVVLRSEDGQDDTILEVVDL